jgi:hypothetical protein
MEDALKRLDNLTQEARMVVAEADAHNYIWYALLGQPHTELEHSCVD